MDEARNNVPTWAWKAAAAALGGLLMVGLTVLIQVLAGVSTSVHTCERELVGIRVTVDRMKRDMDDAGLPRLSARVEALERDVRGLQKGTE